MIPFFLLAMLAGASSPSRGDDTPPPESAMGPQPTPLEIVAPDFEGPVMLPYERRNRLDVWQYYAVDRQGRWRPRVIYSPYGPYYLYNGAPFPYTSTRMSEFMPYAD
jgi:hypothetical protein